MSNSTPLQRAAGSTAVREATNAHPLLLEHGRAWLVQTGRIDVFATRMEGGEPAGSRTHLFRVAAGESMVGTGEAAGMALLGVGAPGTTLLEVDLAPYRERAPDAAARPRLARALHGWVERLYDTLALEGRIPRHRTLDPGAVLEVEAGACVRPTPQLSWIQPTAGSVSLAGGADVALAEGELLPISRRAWVQAAGPATLRLVTTEELLSGEGEWDPAAAWDALDHLQLRVLERVADRLSAAEHEQRERARKQKKASQDAMTSAMARLALTMQKPVKRALLRARPPGDEKEEESLLAAFRLVAAAEGIEVGHLPKGHELLQSSDPIQAVARAYRVRTRRVTLRGEWWKRDNGPLLGRLAERSRAVALFPLPDGGYNLVDPFARTETRVDEKVAETIGHFAFTLYSPFSPEPLNARELWRFGQHNIRRDRTTAIMAGAGVALLGLVTPMAIGMLYDVVIPGADRAQLLQLTIGLVIAALASVLFQVARGFALLRIESKVGPRLQAAVLDRLLSLPLPFFRDYAAGDLADRAMAIEEMRRILSGAVVNVLLGGIFSLANFGLLFYYSPHLAKLAAFLIALAVLTTGLVSYAQLRSQRTILQLRAKNSGLVLQLLTGLSKLRLVGAEPQAFALWARLFSDQRVQQYRTRTLGNLLSVFNAAFPVLATLVLFWSAAPPGPAGPGAGGAPVPDPLATGDFLAFVAAFNFSLGAMLSSSTALIGALVVIPLYEQIGPILRATPEVHAGKHDPGELSGALELQHVTFRYHGDGPTVLQDVSIRVKPGEFVALVGASGSGKSTIVRMLLGFETPETGSVTFDEQELSGLDLLAVRRQIGVVVQNSGLMSGDIFTNITGPTTATMDDAWEAARMAGLDEDIKQMPMGMYTVINTGGGTLSGGQRQRLMIARALVHRPRILFFDEATSALDNRTQEIVSHSLDTLKVTRVVVAHRLSTIRNADRIYVIQNGSVAEHGTYDELFARDGLFAELARRQLV